MISSTSDCEVKEKCLKMFSLKDRRGKKTENKENNQTTTTKDWQQQHGEC